MQMLQGESAHVFFVTVHVKFKRTLVSGQCYSDEIFYLFILFKDAQLPEFFFF